MHIKRDITIWNLKMILNFLNRKPGFSGWSKRMLTFKVQQFKSRLRLEPKISACVVQIKNIIDLYIECDVTTLKSFWPCVDATDPQNNGK